MVNKVLLDEKNLAGDKFSVYNDKISVSKVFLARSPDKGGMPFIFCFTSTKEHHLDEVKIPYLDDNGDTVYYKTAATDGKKYYWSTDILDMFGVRETAIITAHETYHQVLQHCDPHRSFGKNKKIWAIAIDYVVNACIEHDMITCNQVSKLECDRSKNDKKVQHPIWKGAIGGTKGAVYIDELLKSIEDDVKAVAKGMKNNTWKPVVPTGKEAEHQPKPQILRPYADYSIYAKSAEEVYDLIMKKIKDECGKNGIDPSDVLGQNYVVISMGGGDVMDEHKEVDISRIKLFEEIMDAATAAKTLSAGSLPASIEDQLKKLQEPKLKWQDLVRQALQIVRQEKGAINDWSRVRRRFISLEMFYPKKKDNRVRWLAGLDCSGSMSDEDICYAVSQLKVLDGRSEGIIVPWDAQVYWDKAVKIHNAGDLQNTNVVGRGGTIVQSFFEDWEKHIPKQMEGDIDLIIMLTDGYLFDDLKSLKRPKCDVVWVLSSDNKEFKPPFGRVAPLRSF